MRKVLHVCMLLMAISAFMPSLAMAQSQCVYTAKASYNTLGIIIPTDFFAATSWEVTGGTSCSPFPVSGSNSKIIINGANIALSSSYRIGSGGSINISNTGSLTANAGSVITVDDDADLIIGSGGSLLLPSTAVTINSLVVTAKGQVLVEAGGAIKGGNMLLGDNTGRQAFTNLYIQSNSANSNLVRLNQLTVDKATVTVEANSFLTTTCNLVLIDAQFNASGIIVVNGNLDLSGGNTTACQSGTFAVRGCIYATDGQKNHFLATSAQCSIKPNICALGRNNNGCPGPIATSDNNGNSITCYTSFDVPATLPAPNGACGPLPVELIEFTATSTFGQGVVLQWATASEKNNKEFTVERSGNGQQFRGIKTVPGAVNSSRRTAYESKDEQPLPGVSYYRLRQTDIDGTTSFSPVRSVKVSSSAGALEVYPGRAAQEWVVSSTLPAELVSGKAAAVQVFDAVGRVQRIACTPDASLAGRWTLDTHTLPAGIYIVRLLTPSGSYSQRIAK